MGSLLPQAGHFLGMRKSMTRLKNVICSGIIIIVFAFAKIIFY